MPNDQIGTDQAEAGRQLILQIGHETFATAERVRGIERQVRFTRRLIGRPDHTDTLDQLAIAEQCLETVLASCRQFLDAQVIGLRGSLITAESIQGAPPPESRKLAG